jgi:hypothetical protein
MGSRGRAHGRLVVQLLVVLLTACGPLARTEGGPGEPAPDAGTGPSDAGVPEGHDAGPVDVPDAGPGDAPDAGPNVPDAGVPSHEPAGMTVIADHRGQSDSEDGWGKHPKEATGTIVAIETPSGDNSALQFRYPAGLAGGHGPEWFTWKLVGSSDSQAGRYRELYLRFHWKRSLDWTQVGNSQNGEEKLFYLYHRLDANNRRAGVLFITGHKGQQHFRYRYSLDSPVYNPLDSGTFAIEDDRWYQFELYEKMSSGWGVADGVLKVWLDGELILSDDAYVTYDTWVSELHWNPVWGGSGGVKPKDEYYWYDGIYASAR